jgi:regulator of sirC expression with transglutaminase-like and TPR domain
MATSLVKLVQPAFSLSGTVPDISEETVSLIDRIGVSLPHRKLKGHTATTLEQLQALPPEEIDVGRGLVLIDKECPPTMTPIEAALDVLALEILSKVGKEATDEQKISALSHLLFDDLAIRFPPESEAAEKTKQFSDLSSVLFSRRGVCLGASVLYLALAQRIGLPLSIYTPPGHIFVGHKSPERTHVIETTARGIDIPLDRYLGLTLKSVPERSQKEVIGMVLFNRASEYLKKKDWEGALRLYHRAEVFETDEELSLLISLCDFLSGRTGAAVQHATHTLHNLPPYRREPDLLLVDLANGSISREAAEAVIQWSDAKGDDLAPAIEALQKLMPSNQNSFMLPLHLAQLQLEFGRPKEALPLIENLARRSAAPVSIHVLLAELHLERMNIKNAWDEVFKAVKKAQEQGSIPKPLSDLIIELQADSPSCRDMSNTVYEDQLGAVKE